MKIKTLWRIPDDLGEHGRVLFRRVGKALVKANALDDLDRESFETLCRDYDLMRKAQLELDRDGLTVATPNGDGLKKHPAFSIWKTAHDNYVRLCSHFGLSPMARGLKVDTQERKQSEKARRFF